jgi:hypothetical protein
MRPQSTQRLLASCLATLGIAATLAAPRTASADTMDPALARLVTDASCRTSGKNGGLYYNPASKFSPCVADDAAFAKLIGQYGFAIAPNAMHSARTTGYGGFELAVESSFTKIDSDASYWQNGTQGAQDPSTKNFSTINKSPDSLLQVYALKIRKGFPFGLELTGNVGYVAHTNIVTGGADVRFSLLEGFRRGIPAIFPEIAVGGSVRTITGTSEFQLTVAGFDAQVSKPVPIAGTVVLTPYVGYQWIRIFGDSGLIDLTPNTDAVNYCNYQGPNTPSSPDPAKVVNGKNIYDGQPVCKGGSGGSADFNNNTVFAPVRMTRHRIDFGAQLRFHYVKFGTHFLTDIVDPKDANQGDAYMLPDPANKGQKVNEFEGVKRQWTLAFDLGAVF